MPWQQQERNSLSQFKLYDSGGPIPTLQEMFDFVAGKVPILIELKGSVDMAQAMYPILKGYSGEYAIQSFQPEVVYWFSQNMPSVPRGLLAMGSENYSAAWPVRFVLANLLLAHHVQAQFIGYDQRLVTGRWIKFVCRTLDIPLISWTVRDRQTYERISSSVDNIIFENGPY